MPTWPPWEIAAFAQRNKSDVNASRGALFFKHVHDPSQHVDGFHGLKCKHRVGNMPCLQLALLYGPAARCKPKMMIWRRLVLRFCIRPFDGAFELLAIMDIRARSISLATRPRRPEGPPDHERAGETFSPSPLSDSQTSAGKPTLAFGISLSRQPFPG